MPTYDYECSNGHQFEYLQSITAEPLSQCITCGGTGIIFKGSGFYVTDSKNGKHAKQPAKKEEGGADTAAKDGAAKSGEKSGDKKPAESSKSSGDKATKSTAAT